MIIYNCMMKHTVGHWGVIRVNISVRLDVRFTVTHQISHIYTMNRLALHQRMMILWLWTTL